MLTHESPPAAKPRSSPDSVGYRDAMAKLGAAVHIVTSSGSAGVVGVTASAVCSVTDAPPTLLICLNQSSSSHDILIANKVLCINTLSAHHESLSRQFSSGKPMAERFGAANWGSLATGCPVLDDALVAFDCRISNCIDQSSHSVVFCEVVAIRKIEGKSTGLIYFERRYHPIEGCESN